jgi:hypothetical protein
MLVPESGTESAKQSEMVFTASFMFEVRLSNPPDVPSEQQTRLR